MACTVPNCGGKVVAKGLCDKHRKRLKRNGSEYIHINQPWGEARTMRVDFYIYITVDGKQVMEHRYMMEQHLGRKLTDDEVVHHKNKKRWDNRLDNFELMTKAAHSRLHGHERTADQMQYMRDQRSMKH